VTPTIQSPAAKRVPWWRQEVEGSKLQILGSKAASKGLSYLVLALLYGIVALRWWAVVVMVVGILIAMLLARAPKRPLSILDSAPEKPVREQRNNVR
jgi:hypothetical protein